MFDSIINIRKKNNIQIKDRIVQLSHESKEGRLEPFFKDATSCKYFRTSDEPFYKDPRKKITEKKKWELPTQALSTNLIATFLHEIYLT